jgi:hypothetical protein
VTSTCYCLQICINLGLISRYPTFSYVKLPEMFHVIKLNKSKLSYISKTPSGRMEWFQTRWEVSQSETNLRYRKTSTADFINSAGRAFLSKRQFLQVGVKKSRWSNSCLCRLLLNVLSFVCSVGQNKTLHLSTCVVFQTTTSIHWYLCHVQSSRNTFLGLLSCVRWCRTLPLHMHCLICVSQLTNSSRNNLYALLSFKCFTLYL